MAKSAPIEINTGKKSYHPVSKKMLKRCGAEWHHLSADFGNNVALFSAMTEFLVPNTKNLLRLLVSLDRPVNLAEFNGLAKKIGVSDQKNLDATLQALIGTGTIKFNDKGEIEVESTGKMFLDFEARLARINQQ